jgi:ATP-dependent Lhr-like helicase
VSLETFTPAVRAWFAERLGEPTAPQAAGWPLIQAGKHVLIAAPTGSGKTLAAFLSAIDGLVRQGPYLPNETQVLYVSPLKALSNDVQKNLSGPLAEIRARDPFCPDVRVSVRTGDTPATERARMVKKPPHILVTTPESLYILLTSGKGRAMLATAKTIIVDEIHALAKDKRGSHLALSLERLEALTGRPIQRIGLSATQKPLEAVAKFLGGDREVELVDAGTFRTLDVAVEVPKSPLEAVCSHEVWEEIYERMAELIREHKTTLLFVNTRKLAERIAARLAKVLGDDMVTSHHGSLSRARRLDAEERLKNGRLRALVATASLELGIDIGDVDLAIQVGSCRSIATFLQRVGRAGHALKKVPKGRIFPLTMDELVEAAAVLECVRDGILDRTPQPPAPLDILAQQVVASCVAEGWDEERLFAAFRRSWPYRALTRAAFDEILELHAKGRRALLHRDGVNGRVMATRRARLTAITSGGAIPDTADYQVLLEPDGAAVGTVNEDFAIESNAGDIFQLGTTSWRIVRVEPGIVRVADAKGAPPTLPFWLGEAPGRTTELSAAIAELRERGATEARGVPDAAREQITEYVREGRQTLGCVPTQKRVVLERFFDESGGTQLVVHAPFGSRINRAWGLALRKRFCVGFGFELQAAATEEAILLSLGPQHSFKLDDVFDYLHPNTARDVLVQALLAAPMFETRWRWNVQRSLLLERFQSGKKVPAALVRMRANDLLVMAFPQVLACPETLPGGPLPVPTDHPIVRQTIEDCLTEAMDVEGFLQVLRDLRSGAIEKVAVDTPEPSAFSRGILAAHPYSFLDDAPLEERRTQAVLQRRVIDERTADELGELDPAAIARVKEEAWPSPENAEEVHEALTWMGYATEEEAKPWASWLAELGKRVVIEGGRWFAVEAPRDEKSLMRGRLEAVVPIVSDDPVLLALQKEGVAMRARIGGREVWCHRRLLARIQRYTLETLRKEIEPVTAAEFLRLLGCWQHADSEHHLEGPRGLAEVVRQLAGFELPAWAWEGGVLPARVRGYKREWLDQLTLSGEFAWGRLWSAGSAPIKTTPVCIVPRDELETWLSLASSLPPVLSGRAAPVFEALSARGAMFPQELVKAAGLLPAHLEMALGELIAAGLVTCDSYGALRWLIVPPGRRKVPVATVGRWVLLRAQGGASQDSLRRQNSPGTAPSAEFVAKQLLARTGVVFRKTIAREKIPVPWRDLVRVYRAMEARGDVRGGRFVAGFDGEQYARPEAVSLLRAVRRRGELEPVVVGAADPLNFRGILTPDEKVSPTTRGKVRVG